jgi:hypothetical protein
MLCRRLSRWLAPALAAGLLLAAAPAAADFRMQAVRLEEGRPPMPLANKYVRVVINNPTNDELSTTTDGEGWFFLGERHRGRSAALDASLSPRCQGVPAQARPGGELAIRCRP